MLYSVSSKQLTQIGAHPLTREIHLIRRVACTNLKKSFDFHLNLEFTAQRCSKSRDIMYNTDMSKQQKQTSGKPCKHSISGLLGSPLAT